MLRKFPFSSFAFVFKSGLRLLQRLSGANSSLKCKFACGFASIHFFIMPNVTMHAVLHFMRTSSVSIIEFLIICSRCNPAKISIFPSPSSAEPLAHFYSYSRNVDCNEKKKQVTSSLCWWWLFSAYCQRFRVVFRVQLDTDKEDEECHVLSLE